MAEPIVPVGERFIGRTDETRQLDTVLAAARAGRGAVVLVAGDAGIGKTRFVEEVAQRADQWGMTVAAARCWVDRAAPAAWPWTVLLRQLHPGAEPVELDGDRFAACTRVSDRVEEACARSPVCVIVDDVHAADEDTLRALLFVARSAGRLPLAVVLSRRPEAARSAPADRLLDEIGHESAPVVLHGLGPEETAAIVGDDLEADLVGVLHRLTRGNPRSLRRLTALGESGALHAAVDEALDTLPSTARQIIQASAVLGLAPSVTHAAAVARRDPAAVLDAVAVAAPAGLVADDGTDSFSYVHEPVRSCLEASLSGAERLDAHAHAATALTAEGPVPPEQLVRRARHSLAAAPRSVADARHAVGTCQAAASSLVAASCYPEADELLSAAVDLHGSSALGPAPGPLLLRWAQAALRLGRMVDARDRFDRAVAATQDAADPVPFAEAALGLGGHGVYEHRDKVERLRVLGLQRTALARLPQDPRHEALRCRLEARLAAESVIHTGPAASLFAAVDEARDSGDVVALAEALALCHHVLLTPENARRRLQIAEELLGVAAEAGDGALELMGSWCYTVDLIHLGDPCAVPSLEVVRQRAEALGAQNMRANVALADVMLLMRAGRLEEAEVAAQRCYERNLQLGEVNARNYLGAQLLGIRWIQGRVVELVGLAEDVASSPTVVEADFSFHAVAAAILARAGQPQRARALAEQRLGGDLAGLPQTTGWLIGMLAVVDLAASLDDAALAKEAYELLLPYRGYPMIGGSAVLCLGSTERGLGLAARTFGDVDRSLDHLERAVEANLRLGHLPLVAIAQADLAQGLSRRDAGDDRYRARSLLAEAVAAADDLGLGVRAAAWQEDLRARDGSFHRDRNRWVVTLDEHRVRVPDLIGMRYLLELLTHPGEEVPALTLASVGAVPREAARQEVLDDDARAAYAARAQELTAELAEAEANNDITRAEQLRVELDALVEELEAAVGLRGRPRHFGDQTERARTAVQKAIKRAIDVIDEASPPIADQLRASITTGTTCSYTARDGVHWSTDPH